MGHLTGGHIARTVSFILLMTFYLVNGTRMNPEQAGASFRNELPGQVSKVELHQVTTESPELDTNRAAGPPATAEPSSVSGSVPSRTLKQVNTRCPAGCAVGGCVMDSTSGGYKCNTCQGSLLLQPVNGTCSCPAGRYGTNNTCADCLRGSFCPGGTYTGPNTPAMATCPGVGMTTTGRRSTSIRACVNQAGYSYGLNLQGNPVVTLCPADTYSPGLRKQRACVPCPPGYTTAGATGRSSVKACVVPEGYYLKGPGQVAPCPKGEYKSGLSEAASCTKCVSGATTPAVASTSEANCTVLLSSYYATSVQAGAIKATKKCPQSFVCQGGPASAAFDPLHPSVTAGTNVVQCPNGTYTENIGASSSSACMTPPGFKTVDGVTTPCADGEFRPDWKPPSAATNCSVCGEGIASAAAEQLALYDPVTAALSTVDVRASAATCYIKAGQGMYYNPTTNTYRAVNCDTNSYGVANMTYGLATYPCRDCPTGMQTSTSLPSSAAYYASDGAGKQGFTSPLACVTKAGFGYNGRVATKCPAGSFNAAGNYGTCTPCPTGLSTPDSADSQVSAANCSLAVGYGFHDNTIVPCPVGTYNDLLRSNTTAPCTACPTSLTTSQAGGRSLDDCNVCVPGYGDTDCAMQCGGGNATYGPPGRPKDAPCEPCPLIATGFSFDYLAINRNFSPAVVARAGAVSPAECLAEFGQITDTAFYMGGAVAMTSVAVNTFAACVDDCKRDATCQYITFDYDFSQCSKKVASNNGARGDVLAFKAFLAGDVSAASKKHRTNSKGLASGSYTFWNEAGTGIGASNLSVSTTSFTACLSACNDNAECAGVSMTGVTSATAAISSCLLIKGDSTIATFKRSMTKVVTTRLVLPDVQATNPPQGQQTVSCATQPTDPPGGTFGTCNKPTGSLESCGGTCTSGFGTLNAVCTGSNNWTIDNRCRPPNTCDSTLATVTGGNGTVTCDGPTVNNGGTCSLSCNTGLRATFPTVTCQVSGTQGTFSKEYCCEPNNAVISSGGWTLCELVSGTGVIRCRGPNDYGQSMAPADTHEGYQDMDAGFQHTCGILCGSRKIRCWGADYSGQATLPAALVDERWAAVSAGDEHTCGILEGSRVLKCWGSNGNNESAVPAELASARWELVSAGGYATCGITEGGSLHCFGPAWVTGMPTDVTQWSTVSVGYSHACGLETGSGIMQCWGINLDGAYNLAQTYAGAVWSDVSAGRGATCGILGSDSTVKCSGYADNGGYVPTELRNVSFSKVTVAVGGCGRLKADNTLMSWWGFDHVYPTFP